MLITNILISIPLLLPYRPLKYPYGCENRNLRTIGPQAQRALPLLVEIEAEPREYEGEERHQDGHGHGAAVGGAAGLGLHRRDVLPHAHACRGGVPNTHNQGLDHKARPTTTGAQWNRLWKREARSDGNDEQDVDDEDDDDGDEDDAVDVLEGA